uniref:Superoxide dismutase [Cu-Zn] n=1 Tax=Phaedon cochleariae TaxID=80249 RepID=A0A0S2A4G9_PHACE|nr:Cu/Zn superoxide dismutase isoform 2 [Phaedon cochleariae]
MFKFVVAVVLLSGTYQFCNCDVHSATVRLYDPTGNTEVTGELNFTQVENGVRITGEIHGIHEGKHGGHVHVDADISKGCIGAGGPFNPHNVRHAGPDDEIRNTGDLGNVVGDRFGVAHIDVVDKRIKLNKGIDGIIGRGFVIHEKEDDLGRGNNAESGKTGNSGGRIACGVIEVLEE